MKDIIILEEVTSTNDYLKQYYKQLKNGTVVVAKKQLKGRGRSNHKWQSPQGNLYMSVLYKDIKREDVFQHLMNASVSLVKLLKAFNIHAFIKYPNDIIVNRKKISGILMETHGLDVMDFLIIGIGLNVNQIDFKELQFRATSLSKEIGDEQDINDVMHKLLAILEQDKDLYKEYLIHSFVLGKQIHYKGSPYFVEGINQDGTMRLKGERELDVHMNQISLEELYE